MGAGKSTFARALLKALGVRQSSEGSPTFAIAHEYRAPICDIAHIDFYRFKSELEIEEAGIHTYFWERPMIVLAEWVSSWPEFEESLLRADAQEPGRRNWRVRIAYDESDPESGFRSIQIERLAS